MRPASLARIIAATSLGFVVVQLDVTIVNVALPRIGADLHSDVSMLQWVVDAYAMAFAVLLLTGGTIGDRFGAKRPLQQVLGYSAGRTGLAYPAHGHRHPGQRRERVAHRAHRVAFPDGRRRHDRCGRIRPLARLRFR